MEAEFSEICITVAALIRFSTNVFQGSINKVLIRGRAFILLREM